jgi:hypothetical protein
MRPVTASLDPQQFRHEILDRPATIQISQIDHGFQVRSMPEMHIPCACGRPLCGIETDVLTEPRGFAVYYRGVCLTCGNQEGMYLSEPAATADVAERAHTARLKADIAAILEQVDRLRSIDDVSAIVTDIAAQGRVEAA